MTSRFKNSKYFSRWNSEPNDWLGAEDCASIYPGNRYNDQDCTRPAAFICEYINLFGTGE